MKFGGMGFTELLIIIVVIVVIFVIFGPKNLPKLGTALGKTVKNLREGLGGGKKKEEKSEEKAKEEEPEELEVIDKPEPGQKAAADKPAEEAENLKKEKAE